MASLYLGNFLPHAERFTGLWHIALLPTLITKKRKNKPTVISLFLSFTFFFVSNMRVSSLEYSKHARTLTPRKIFYQRNCRASIPFRAVANRLGWKLLNIIKGYTNLIAYSIIDKLLLRKFWKHFVLGTMGGCHVKEMFLRLKHLQYSIVFITMVQVAIIIYTILSKANHFDVNDWMLLTCGPMTKTPISCQISLSRGH